VIEVKTAYQPSSEETRIYNNKAPLL